MSFLVNMPVNIAGMLGNFAAWNPNNGPAFLQPMDKPITIVSPVRDHMFSPQIKRFQQFLRITNVIVVSWRQQKPQWVSQPIYYRMDFRGQSSPAASQLFLAPFLAPLHADGF